MIVEGSLYQVDLKGVDFINTKLSKLKGLKMRFFFFMQELLQLHYLHTVFSKTEFIVALVYLPINLVGYYGDVYMNIK